MEIRSSKHGHRLHTLVILILFLVFALSSVSVLMYGTKVYKSVTEKTNENYSLRTGLIYLSNKIKAADKSSIYMDTYQKVDMLVIPEEIEGQMYETRIYCYNGQLREIFTDVGNDIPLDGGLYITDMKNLTISEKNKGLLEIEAEYEDIGKRKLIVNIKEEQ
ncbi:hypothetical protein B5E58_09310 [Tyzzerella sp. An114]|uniref:DUF4860 domain-containing protein n=1 Tax=Tyzzerella sp. An114 TaxID=1965545 RepID=UPI000B43862E|nr:DUF4860 domain-containing protein [Tyzzerella sp. An114]OUQ57424.1 hypothetical protein B5E58_09310 [Tyzzerella sp. An114]